MKSSRRERLGASIRRLRSSTSFTEPVAPVQTMQQPSTRRMVQPMGLHVDLPSPAKEQKARQLRRLAKRQYDASDFHAAVVTLSSALRTTPGNHHFYSDRASCWLRMGDYNRSFNDARNAVQLCYQWPKGYIQMGAALERMERHEDAKRCYDQAAKFGYQVHLANGKLVGYYRTENAVPTRQRKARKERPVLQSEVDDKWRWHRSTLQKFCDSSEGITSKLGPNMLGPPRHSLGDSPNDTDQVDLSAMSSRILTSSQSALMEGGGDWGDSRSTLHTNDSERTEENFDPIFKSFDVPNVDNEETSTINIDVDMDAYIEYFGPECSIGRMFADWREDEQPQGTAIDVNRRNRDDN